MPSPKPIYVDFHAHTTASDGTYTPTQLVRAALNAGLGYLAITDHDTTAGVAEALEAAKGTSLRILPGVELSVEGAPGKCHLLGLGIRYEDPALNSTLRAVSEDRRTRNLAIVERLNTLLKTSYTLSEVEAVAPPGANVGRPHFAEFLLRKGHVRDLKQAFLQYLGDGRSAYVEKKELTCAEGIELVHSAGGLCFLAHPALTRLEKHETMETRVRQLEELGMDGIEVYYPEHTTAMCGKLLRLAQKYHLLVTGGSDFHGTAKPNRLGCITHGTAKLPSERVTPVLLDAAADATAAASSRSVVSEVR
ncbi:MAG: PHP domain-containing protein [Capsulimonadales bacterium]|nr:PHP domain-containing protein [Capsulimonadales bacterium]